MGLTRAERWERLGRGRRYGRFEGALELGVGTQDRCQQRWELEVYKGNLQLPKARANPVHGIDSAKKTFTLSSECEQRPKDVWAA